MENPRPEKVAVVDEVRERLRGGRRGAAHRVPGPERQASWPTLRRSLRDAGGEYKIYKNTLVRFAARDLGLDELEALLTGPTAIAFVDGDAAAVAKALRDFARTNPNLVVKGGLLGDKVLTRRRRRRRWPTCRPARCCWPSSPVPCRPRWQQFAGLLQALPRNFAYGLKALIDQQAVPGRRRGTRADAAETPAAEAAAEPSRHRRCRPRAEAADEPDTRSRRAHRTEPQPRRS